MVCCHEALIECGDEDSVGQCSYIASPFRGEQQGEGSIEVVAGQADDDNGQKVDNIQIVLAEYVEDEREIVFDGGQLLIDVIDERFAAGEDLVGPYRQHQLVEVVVIVE